MAGALRSSPYICEGQIFEECGIGLCDPMLRNNILAMTAFVYDTSFYVWTLVGNADGGNIEITSGQERAFMDTTLGGPVDGGWMNKTLAYTNTLKQAGLVKKGLTYVAFGMIVDTREPVQRGGTGASVDDPELRSAWLGNSASGPNYSAELTKFILNMTTFKLEVVDGGTEYNLGPAAFMPGPFGPRGQTVTSNGELSCIQFACFPIAFCIGDADSGTDVDFTGTVGVNAAVQSASPPTVAGSEEDTAGTINTANQGDVYVPVRVIVVGVPMCYPLADICGIPTAGLTPQQAAALQSMGLAPAGQAQGAGIQRR